MSVVNEAVQDGVAQGGVADDVVPMFDGDLAGDDGRGATVAIIEDLQKVAPFGRTENRKTPVVEDQELNPADGFEQAAIAAVAASQGERLEQARNAVILDRTIVAAGFVAEGAGNPALAEPGQTNGIMPGVRRLKCGSPIRSTRAVANWCRLSDANAMEALIISSFVSPTPPWRFCRPG